MQLMEYLMFFRVFFLGLPISEKRKGKTKRRNRMTFLFIDSHFLKQRPYKTKLYCFGSDFPRNFLSVGPRSVLALSSSSNFLFTELMVKEPGSPPLETTMANGNPSHLLSAAGVSADGMKSSGRVTDRATWRGLLSGEFPSSEFLRSSRRDCSPFCVYFERRPSLISVSIASLRWMQSSVKCP